ncbi:MAG: ABC transporter ATP-binding protein [Thermoflavifilum sp.]|nr:ABC transporter ATP-binding protein [Thermoflavifilum sp.]MCL6514114.1 ABC transporter ATP-binding protein [Alicyclobacillus sp.]
MDHVVEVRNLSKRIHGRTVLDHVDLTVQPGSIHALIGANGAGKSTLLRVIAGLYSASAGEVLVLGERMDISRADLRQHIHLAGTDMPLPHRFTVAQYARYASLLYERWDAARWERLRRALALPEKQPVRRLSFGMRMQVQLAIALSTHPSLLLLDEPTVGLDAVVRRQAVQWLLDEAQANGMSVVVASHQLDELERLADQVTVLYEGRTVISGSLEELKQAFVRVTVRGDQPLPADVQAHSGVWTWERDGRLGVSLLVRRSALEEVLGALCVAGVGQTLVHEDLPLEELFRLWLKREGYSRDAFTLA